MQFILLLSAILATLSGAVTGRVAAPQPVESASSASVAVVAEPAAIVVAVAAAVFAPASRVLPLPRAFAFRRTIAIYQERRRE